MEEKYKKLFDLFDPKHCLEFREIIRRLSKTQLNKKVLVQALGDGHNDPDEENIAAAIVLVYHFLYDLGYKELFRLLDCCKTKEDTGKVERRIRSTDVANFDKEFLERLSGNTNDEKSSVKLAKKLLYEIEQRKHQKRVEEVLALF